MYTLCPFCHQMTVTLGSRIAAGQELRCTNEQCQAHYSLDFDSGELRWSAPVVTPCQHPHTAINRGHVYEYCEECGAVRTMPRPGRAADTAWHSCELCRRR